MSKDGLRPAWAFSDCTCKIAPHPLDKSVILYTKEKGFEYLEPKYMAVRDIPSRLQPSKADRGFCVWGEHSLL